MSSINLTKDPISKLFYKFAIPSCLATLVNAMYVVVDGVFITRGVGSEGIAAVNIGYPLINLVAAISLMFGVGGATLISIKNDNIPYKNKCFSYIILLNLFFYILVAGLVFIYTTPIMKFMGANDNLMPMVKGYMYPCTLATFFLMISISLNAVVRNDNAPKHAMISVLLGAAINVILDYIFIFKMDLGIKGGAYATAIGQIISAIYLCKHFIGSTFKFSLDIKNIDFNLIGRIFSIGFSSFILEFAVVVITVLLNITLITKVGLLGASAYGIISYSFVVLRMLFTGLAQGIQPIVSFNYGRGDMTRVKETFWYSQKISFILAVISLILTKIFAVSIVKIFTTETGELIPITAHGLFLYTSAIIFMGSNFINISYLQSMERAAFSNIISVLRGIVFVFIALKILPELIGIDGIWLGLPASDFLTFILTYIWFYFFQKKLI
ncbi:MAG: MATE family efflux transporter [Cetobacterium sp.]|uniref:MATE family efflux transporter n=1 Tax=Cetobacterium sp. TaxID=2071632 RepID=UPI003F2D18C7